MELQHRIHFAANLCDVSRILAKQGGFDQFPQHGQSRRLILPGPELRDCRFADPSDSLVGVNSNDHIGRSDMFAVGCFGRHTLFQRYTDRNSFDTSDLHEGSPGSDGMLNRADLNCGLGSDAQKRLGGKSSVYIVGEEFRSGRIIFG